MIKLHLHSVILFFSTSTEVYYKSSRKIKHSGEYNSCPTALPLNRETIGCFETSVTDYQSTLLNFPKLEDLICKEPKEIILVLET
jgi:hypothetical protein